MSFTVRRSVLVVIVSLVVVIAGAVVASQRASAASATPVVYVATGENFPDALGASAAAAVQGGPVLLVTKTSIPTETKTELNRLKPDVIYVAGGTMVVSDTVFNQLKAYAPSVVRVAGTNRYATAAEVSESAFPVTGGGNTAALEAQVTVLSAEVDALQAMLAGVSRDGSTLQFSGMNLQIVNGQGSTATANSVGNIIIGYNEPATPVLRGYRAGSHYLIIGEGHAYTRHGGIVAGLYHTATGSYASVLSGVGNTASGNYSTVIGGNQGTASGEFASVTTGYNSTASAGYTSILGGQNQTVSSPAGTYPFCGCTP